MKRTFAIIFGTLAATALFGGLVYAVLVAAHISEPAATTVYGLTPPATLGHYGRCAGTGRRCDRWPALARPASGFGTAFGRLGAIAALMAGLMAGVNGVLNLAVASGGPGTGNGVVGGAAALVLGLIAVALSGLALARCRRTVSGGAQVCHFLTNLADC